MKCDCRPELKVTYCHLATAAECKQNGLKWTISYQEAQDRYAKGERPQRERECPAGCLTPKESKEKCCLAM